LHHTPSPWFTPLHVQDVDVPLSVSPVTVPASQDPAFLPHTPLTFGGNCFATLHQAPNPRLMPVQVQDIEVPLSVNPVTTPAAHVPALVAQTPLIAGSGALHDALAPFSAPLHVHVVLLPLSFDPVTVPAAQVLTAFAQLPVTVAAGTGDGRKIVAKSSIASRSTWAHRDARRSPAIRKIPGNSRSFRALFLRQNTRKKQYPVKSGKMT
jgi:hypothetical protein